MSVQRTGTISSSIFFGGLTTSPIPSGSKPKRNPSRFNSRPRTERAKRLPCARTLIVVRSSVVGCVDCRQSRSRQLRFSGRRRRPRRRQPGSVANRERCQTPTLANLGEFLNSAVIQNSTALSRRVLLRSFSIRIHPSVRSFGACHRLTQVARKRAMSEPPAHAAQDRGGRLRERVRTAWATFHRHAAQDRLHNKIDSA